ncbi:MAG: glutamine--tRNA ligase/YqeY domain fusion protein [Desulfatibacillum sp.]|nr:glutamine--tRNA ligase/YqeY domain fusion protein [Desulfatibacillum sp.]
MAKPDHMEDKDAAEEGKEKSLDFIRTVIAQDNETGKHAGRVATRFPPEPNGYLHIGHAKSICLNFGIAREQEKGTCNLRFDDTNPAKEDVEYVDSIMEDVRWMGFKWDELHYASDYFERLYEFAVELIKARKAYVCDLSPEEVRAYRGTLKEPGKNSPYRDRSPEENLDLFTRMRAGEFADGSRVLRAKIDMAAPNLILRDPTLYRIRRAHHHRTGDAWLIYPMYDFTHCLSDSLEGITHSICTLEFENNRALYDWVLDNVSAPCHPQQLEFARLNLTYTVLSKRKLIQLVENGLVNGWDDPRMPTISGLRRRGYSAGAVRNFCEKIGVAKRASTVDMALLEFCVREDLNETAPRVMGVLNPLKVVITNYPEGESEELDCPLHPTDPSVGGRALPFSGELYIEQEDFMEDPPKKFFRLSPGKEVRLRYAYFITCTDVIKDENGQVTELRCTYDPATKGGDAPDGRKVKATLHWVSAPHACTAEVRLYEHLFTVENPNDVEEGKEFTDYINPNSLQILRDCKVEPLLANAAPGYQCQFERMGYFCVDSVNPETGTVVFNRTVTLRDQWTKIQKTQPAPKSQPKQDNKPKKNKGN